MTEEEKKVEETKVVEDNKETQNNDEIKYIDVFGKKVMTSSQEDFDYIIAERDKMVAQHNEVVKREEEALATAAREKAEKEEAQRRADAIEAAKKDDLAKAEELFTQKEREKIAKYEQHSYRSAVKTALLSRSDLIDGAAEDALGVIMNNNQFELTDDFQVKVGDKTVEDVVNEYIDARDYLKKIDPKRGNMPAKTEGSPKQRLEGKDALASGLSKLY